jgi:hypothetical protein
LRPEKSEARLRHNCAKRGKTIKYTYTYTTLWDRTFLWRGLTFTVCFLAFPHYVDYPEIKLISQIFLWPAWHFSLSLRLHYSELSGRIYFPAAELFGRAGRKIFVRVGKTVQKWREMLQSNVSCQEGKTALV